MNTFKNKTTAVVNEALKRRWNIKTDECVIAMIDNSGILMHEEIHRAAREIKDNKGGKDHERVFCNTKRQKEQK
jgi:hypothetical protein